MTERSGIKLLRAKYVLPVTKEPITDGAVVIDGAKIIAVGDNQSVAAAYPVAAKDDLGEAAILPGFVNCHSHLEVTAMRGALDNVENDFRSWLLRLNSIRASMTDDDISVSAMAGALEGARAGITCFGDIGRFGKAGLAAVHSVGLTGVLYQETEFSPENSSAKDDLLRLIDKVSELRSKTSGLVEIGISPHSPYTVSKRLFEKIADYALAEGIKLTIHVAESTAEHELLSSGRGFFAEYFKSTGIGWTAPACSPVEFLKSTGILRAKPLLAHCVTVSEADIDIIAESGSSIAHCPRSNAKFGHGTAPLGSFLERNIGLGLGSDSVASSNSCDMLEEARTAAGFSRSRPGRSMFVTAREMIHALTIGGASALGLSDVTGSIEPGKRADLTVISLGGISQRPVTDPEAAIVFSSNARDVILTIANGREVFKDGSVIGADECRIVARLDEIAAKFPK